ncbi:MAG: glycosyltransferase family 4 protein [Tepidisphaeraceae bacterium]
MTHKVIRSDGQGRVNAEIAFGLVRRGWIAEIISGDVDPELATLPGVRWHRVLTPRRLATAFLRYQWFAIAARRALARLPRVDLLQLNGAIVYGGRGGVNIANFVHSDWLQSPFHPRQGKWSFNAIYQSLFTRLNAAWEKRAFARAERVVAVSESVRDALIARAGVPADRIEVIPPGVDTEQFRPWRAGETNTLRDELKLSADQFVMMFVGDIRSNRKNLDLVLKALPHCGQAVHLAVVGDAARSPYPALANDLGVGMRVHFLGRRTTDLPALLRGADVFVFPSHYDPFALVVTEAMASGLPVITTGTVGASCLIHDGENGLLLDNGTDAVALARVIEELKTNPDRRNAIGLEARRMAEAHTWDAMAEAYEVLFRQVIANRR